MSLIERDALVGNLLDRIDALERAVRLLQDTHPGAPGEVAGKLAYYRVADGSLRGPGDVHAAGDVHADGDSYGLWARHVNRHGPYTDHFRSGIIPTGFTWIADGVFHGAPAALSYSHNGSFMRVASDATPHFLARAITIYADRFFAARMRTGRVTEIGIRVDAGSDDNYAEVILDPDGAGGYHVDFRYRIGGGAIIDNEGPYYPCTEYVDVLLLYLASGPSMWAYLYGEEGGSITVAGFSVAIGWPAARVGMKVQVDGGGYGYFDKFYCTFA